MLAIKRAQVSDYQGKSLNSAESIITINPKDKRTVELLQWYQSGANKSLSGFIEQSVPRDNHRLLKEVSMDLAIDPKVLNEGGS